MFYETDIAIIGGGVAGCIAAMSLSQSYRVVLIDKLEEPPERIGECLAPAARRILKKLDLLEGMECLVEGSSASTHLIHTGTKSHWGSDLPYVSDHLRNPDGFGWHLNRQAFEKYLRRSAELREVKCCWGANLDNVAYQNTQWQLNVKPDIGNPEGHCIRSNFVIDASGRASHFARRLGIEREHHDKLITCWATFPDPEENKMARIVADKTGWWYSASLPGNQRVLAYQTDSDLIDRSFIRKSSQFTGLAKLNPVIAEILEHNPGEIRFMGAVAANSGRLKQVCGQQWAALGDAALSFDPLSSQGMFNAMAGAMELTELIRKFEVVTHLDNLRMQDFQGIYSRQTDGIWEHYLKHKKFFYGEERRWVEEEFWKRRG